MEDKFELELYTRLTCPDCEDAKKYLNSNRIHYADKDVSKNLSLEEDLKEIPGNRIVAMFDFYKKDYSAKKAGQIFYWF